MGEQLSGVPLKHTPESKPEPPLEGQMGVLSDVPPHLTRGASVSEEVLGLGSHVMEVVARKGLLLQQGDTDQIRTMKVGGWVCVCSSCSR